MIEAYLGKQELMALLEVADIHTRYGAIEALKGVSLTVDEGEIVTLIGANGAGQVHHAALDLGPDPGQPGAITFAGEDITACRRTRSSAAGSPWRPRAGTVSPG